MWFSGGLDCAEGTVGLDDPEGLFQPKRFHEELPATHLTAVKGPGRVRNELCTPVPLLSSGNK